MGTFDRSASRRPRTEAYFDTKEKIMSEQQMPLTYEGVLELFRQTDLRMDRMAKETEQRMQETDRRMQETDRRMQETDRRMKETARKISALGSRIGEIVENMIGGDIIFQFQELGYEVTSYYRNRIFGEIGTIAQGEIDLILEDGDVAILIEVKTTLKTEDVVEHVKRLEKYRRHVDERASDGRKFIGAVAGAVVEPNVAQFAQAQGMYVIVQSGRAVEIIPPPEGFVPKKW